MHAPADNCCPVCGGGIATIEDINYDPERRILAGPSFTTTFTPGEGALFELLWLRRRSGGVVLRDAIYDVLYSTDPNGGPDPKTFNVRVSYMRSKLRNTGAPLEIVTVWGSGFFLRAKHDGLKTRIDGGGRRAMA